jgi:hypothetical protein
MVERIAVERLLQGCEQGAAIRVPAGPMLAELCRTWLAVQDAPVATMDSRGCLYGTDPRIGELEHGVIRLVRDGGE